MPTPPRTARLQRKTRETEIRLELSLDGRGETDVHTGLGLFNHMLELLAVWASFDLKLVCDGDLHVDAHHTMEDAGLILGEALALCLGDKKGINRVGDARVPMDEALAEAALDLSGRPWLAWRGGDLLPPTLMGEEIDVWREFYKSFAFSGRFNLHINFLYGKNAHHLLESAAKGAGAALKAAARIDGSALRSTKGVLA